MNNSAFNPFRQVKHWAACPNPAFLLSGRGGNPLTTSCPQKEYLGQAFTITSLGESRKDTNPSPTDLQHHEDEVVVLEEPVEAHDVWIVQAPVDGDLRAHLLLLVRLHQQRLGHHLAREHLFRVHVRDLVALGEAPLSEEATPNVAFHSPGVHQDVWDLLQGRRLGVDRSRRLGLGHCSTHFDQITEKRACGGLYVRQRNPLQAKRGTELRFNHRLRNPT